MTVKKSLGLTTGGALAALCLSLPAMAQTSSDSAERMISFGDSLSDGGANAPFVPQGGTFTTDPDPIWVKVLANGLGLELDPAVAGGLNFAEGGARVFAENGGPTPIATQIQAYLAAGGTFSATDVVTLQGGGNDAFAIQGGRATVDEFVAAAQTLASLAKQIEEAGAGTLIVANVQTINDFNVPFEATLGTLEVNALFLNVDALFTEILANPNQFGITNITDLACTTPSSLTCTTDTLVEPNANRTYALADDVHFTGVVNEMQGNMALSLVYAPQQVGQLAYVGESYLISTIERGIDAYRLERAAGETSFGVDAGVQSLEIDGGGRLTGLDEDATTFSLSIDHQATENFGIGASLSYTDGEGDFGGAFGGGYDSNAFIGTLYARGNYKGLRLGAQASVGRVEFENITRLVQLGTQTRANVGETDGDLLSLNAEAAYDLVGADWFIGPVGGVTTYQVDLGRYAESAGGATSVTFSRNELESVRGYLGAELIAPSGWQIRPYARVTYEGELSGEDRVITVTPFDAPISWTTSAFDGDSEYVAYRAGIEGDFGTVRASLTGGGYTDRDAFDRFDIRGEIRVKF